jgi:RNA polymerase sigma factor (sigma-70 family)
MSFSQGKSDVELWQGLLEGNKSDFAALYQRHAKDLFHYGYKLSSDTDIVQDAIQDLFIEIWSRRINATVVTQIKFYLFKALRYKLIRILKKQSIRLKDHEKDVIDDSAGADWAIPDLQSEQIEKLQHCIQQLPIRQQEALNLKYYQNFSSDEIARIMEINYQSVSNLLFKALETLRKNINQ